MLAKIERAAKINKKTLIFFIFSAGFIGFLMLFLNLMIRGLDVAYVLPEDDSQRKWDPKLLRMVSFGHLPAVLDWLWVKGLSEQAIDHVPQGVHPELYYRLDLITDLDSAFYMAYFAGANLLAVIRNDAMGARDLLIKAKKFRGSELDTYPKKFIQTQWKDPWKISLLLGYVYLMELNDMPNASIEFQEASQYPQAPPYLTRLSKRLQASGGQYEVGLKLLEFLARSTEDERVLERLERQHHSLQIAQFIFHLNEQFKEYLKAQNRLQGGLSDWELFVEKEKISLRDPWGGDLRFNLSGGVTTSTPYEKVFGLD